METENFNEFQAYTEKTLLSITNCSQVSFYLINQRKNVMIKISDHKPSEENSLDIGIIGEVVRTGETIFVQDCQSNPKFNQHVDFKSNLPVHTYPIKDSNNHIIAVVQILTFREALGKKIKKDNDEEDILGRFLTCLGVLYEKINIRENLLK